MYMLDSEGVGIGLRVNQTGFGQRKEMESGFIVLMHTSRMIVSTAIQDLGLLNGKRHCREKRPETILASCLPWSLDCR